MHRGSISTVTDSLSGLMAWVVAAMILAGSIGSAAAQGSAAPIPVTLAWDANPETDVVGYRLYYGTQRGIYPTMVDVGKVTTATLPIAAAGTIYVTATAYNSASLESLPSSELEVVVVLPDVQSPVFSGIPNDLITVPDVLGGTTAVVRWNDPAATDNVGVVSVTSNHRSGEVFPAGTTTVTYTAVDLAGNQASASFQITVGGVELWRQQAFGSAAVDPSISGDQANTDDDSWDNLGEYALGLEAGRNDGYQVFQQSIEGELLVVNFSHNPYLPDVVLRVECSENLAAGWHPVAIRYPGAEWAPAVQGLEIASTRTGTLQDVTLREAIGTRSTAFFRLVVERAEVQ